MRIWDAFYLGQQALIDPTEGNLTAENAAALAGMTFGGPGNALVNDIVTIQTHDPDGDGVLNQDGNAGHEGFDADLGDGLRMYEFDAVSSYNATITYIDGTTATAVVVVFQTVDGHTFISPGMTPEAHAPLAAGAIRSITLDSVNRASAVGFAAERQDAHFVTCFVAGTLIATPGGERPVETLRAGDRVITADHGAQVLRWVGARAVMARGALAPVRFAPGVLGNDRPLMVSPQHRMLLSGWRVELMFGTGEVLAAARHLVDGAGVAAVPGAVVGYHHLMFDAHEIVFANGAACESLFIGDYCLARDPVMARAARAAGVAPMIAARRVLRGYEAAALWRADAGKGARTGVRPDMRPDSRSEARCEARPDDAAPAGVRVA